MSLSRSLLTLPLNCAVPVFVTAEEIQVGRQVFHNFVHDQFQLEGLSDDPVIDDENSDILGDHIARAQNANNPSGVASNINEPVVVAQNVNDPVAMAQNVTNDHIAMAQNALIQNSTIGAATFKTVINTELGGYIRNIADDFAKSRQREQIRMHADQVDLSQITYDRFWGLLEEVFRHGINVYNIVALFYFCSDILIKAVKYKMISIGINLFKWSLSYITDRVCKWIHEQGGWERAFKGLVRSKYIAYWGGAAVVVFACGWGLYKTLGS